MALLPPVCRAVRPLRQTALLPALRPALRPVLGMAARRFLRPHRQAMPRRVMVLPLMPVREAAMRCPKREKRIMLRREGNFPAMLFRARLLQQVARRRASLDRCPGCSAVPARLPVHWATAATVRRVMPQGLALKACCRPRRFLRFPLMICCRRPTVPPGRLPSARLSPESVRGRACCRCHCLAVMMAQCGGQARVLP